MIEEYFEERIEVEANPEEAFRVLSDPARIPQWSTFIRGVVHGLDGWHTGMTDFGPVTFKWEVSEERKEVVMVFDVMGYEVKSYFQVISHNNRTFIVARWPYNPDAVDLMLDTAREMGREELRKLAGIIKRNKK